MNKRNRLQDFFRARVLFPIFDDQGKPVAFGGRKLPDADGPKYQNSREGPLYNKSRTLYALNWAKADVVQHERDRRVRGLHRRDRVLPRRRPAGGRDLRHRAHRGPRQADEAVHQPHRAGVRRRRGRADRGRARLRVGAAPRDRGVGAGRCRRAPIPTSSPAPTRPPCRPRSPRPDRCSGSASTAS